MTTAAIPSSIGVSSEAEPSRWRPSIEVEQVRASWNRADQLFRAIRFRDVTRAVAAYASEAQIMHPIVGKLTKDQLSGALTVFINRTKTYELHHEIRLAGPASAHVAWSIDHVLFVTGRRVRISGVSELVFEGDRIVLHRDYLSVRDWSRQALGLKGLVLSWIPSWSRFVAREMRCSLGIDEGRR